MTAFRRAGEEGPLIKDDPNDPDWVTEDIVRMYAQINVYDSFSFWFEFPRGDTENVIKQLRTAGAEDARNDGGSQIVLVVGSCNLCRDLVAICLNSGGRYMERKPRC
jgi:hypothetical protein